MTRTFNGAKLLLSAAALMCVVSCAAIEGRETSGQYVDDATISTRVRTAFVGDSKVQATQVHVDTMQGIVELSGFVDKKDVEERAVSIARHTDGVKGVRDEIVVR
jgi:hyperosmotically inducible protein